MRGPGWRRADPARRADKGDPFVNRPGEPGPDIVEQMVAGHRAHHSSTDNGRLMRGTDSASGVGAGVIA